MQMLVRFLKQVEIEDGLRGVIKALSIVNVKHILWIDADSSRICG